MYLCVSIILNMHHEGPQRTNNDQHWSTTLGVGWQTCWRQNLCESQSRFWIFDCTITQRTGLGKHDSIKLLQRPMKERISITIDRELLSYLDSKISESIFANRSHGLEYMIKQRLKQQNQNHGTLWTITQGEQLELFTFCPFNCSSCT